MGEFTKTIAAALGVQGYLVFTKTPIGAGQVYLGQRLIDAGAINVAGDYEAEFEISGTNDVEVHLKPSAVTGTILPTLRITYANQFATKASAAGANFAAGVLQSLALASPKGAQYAKVTFTVDGGESVTFAVGADPYSPSAQAEFNAG